MAKSFWSIENNALVWRVADGEPHTDDIEMSGLRCDCIVSYGVKEDGQSGAFAEVLFSRAADDPQQHARHLLLRARRGRARAAA